MMTPVLRRKNFTPILRYSYKKIKLFEMESVHFQPLFSGTKCNLLSLLAQNSELKKTTFSESVLRTKPYNFIL